MLLNYKWPMRASLAGGRRTANIFIVLFLALLLPSMAEVQKVAAAEQSVKKQAGKAANANLPLRLLFWPDYLPDWVYKEFTAKTGIKILFDSYGNYQSMYSQVKDHNGNYDLIQPSGEYAHRMWTEGLLKKIDFSKIPNYAKVDPYWKKTSVDPEEQYSVPMFWGLTGFLINKDKVSPDEVRDYPDLWQEKVRKQLIMVNEARTAFSISLKSLGLSCNDLSPESRKKALEKMGELITDCSVRNLEDGLEDMENGRAAVMVTWAAEGSEYMRTYPNLVFVLPPNPLRWMDCLAMPVNGQATEHAEAFINFLLDPAVSARVAEEVGYSTPNLAAKALLSKEARQDPYLYPDGEVLVRSELESPLYDFAGELDTAWEFLIDQAARDKAAH